jgi:hypothetical protein
MPLPSRCLDEALQQFAQGFRELLSKPQYQYFVLLDTWYSAKCHGPAARERGFLITSGLKSNRWLRVADPTAPQGWAWQRLSAYTARLDASAYVRIKWPKGDQQV